MGIAEDYIESLKAVDTQYHWPMEQYDERQPERLESRKTFPYVVTLKGDYYTHDDIEAWCRKEHGDRHGECHWEECEFSFDTWHKKTGFEDELETELQKFRGKKNLNKRKTKKNKQKRNKAIHDHYDMIEAHPNKPEDHSHKGTWTTIWIMKTGYDYGYQDYCFKNELDAIMFAFRWKGET